MEKIENYEDFIAFTRELAYLILALKISKAEATKTMQRVALDLDFKPIYLW